MDGFFIFFVLVFFVLPAIFKSMNKNGKSSSRKRRPSRTNKWGQSHGQIKAQLHKQLHSRDSADVFPEEHQAHVAARDQRDIQEFRKIEKAIHGRNNKAMTKVGNKSRTDWGVRGESGLTSSKAIVTLILLVLLAHFIVAGFFPTLLPGGG